MSAPDYDQIVGGPAQFLKNDVEIGHTEGGISATISPQNRMRTVDEFGQGEVAVIHVGDQVRMSVPFAEWTADVLAASYNPGYDQTSGGGSGTYMGVGRSAGYIYTTADAKIVPRLAANANKRLQFWRTTPIGQLELNFNNEADRILECEFACLVDEDQSNDGELIGKMQLA